MRLFGIISLFFFFNIVLSRIKDLTNAKEKLEAQISEQQETASKLQRKIYGLVRIENKSCLDDATSFLIARIKTFFSC